MIHDPLCDWLQEICTPETCSSALISDPCQHQWCQCELIAKVRADERLQESTRRAEKFGYWHDYRPEIP